MRALAASDNPQAAALLEKADDLDEALAKDPGRNDGPRCMSTCGRATELKPRLPEVLPQWQAIAGRVERGRGSQ